MAVDVRSCRVFAGAVAVVLAIGMRPALAQGLLPQTEIGGMQTQGMDSTRRAREDEELRQDLGRPKENGVGKFGAARAPGKAPAGSETLRFDLREVRFTPSQILSDAALRAIADRYTGRRVSVADLYLMLDEVNRLYGDQGIVSAKAVLPPQKVLDGEVEVRLIEGKLGAVRVEGTSDLSADYVKDRLSVVAGDLLRVGPLDDDLLRFNWTNDAKLRAQLVPGKAFGTTDLLLHVQEPKSKTLSLTLGNDGRPLVAEYRVGINYRVASLFGHSDPLALGLTGSAGDLNGNMTYGFPLGQSGDRLEFSYVRGGMTIRRGDFAGLNITGSSTATSATLRHPLRLTAQSQLSSYLTAQRTRSFTWFDGVSISDVKSTAASLGVTFQRSATGSVLYAGQGWTRGRSEAPGTEARRYDKYSGYLVWAKAYTAASMKFKGVWQFSRDMNMPASDLFQVGGMGSVRGFAEGLATGHQGYYFNIEGRVPLARLLPGAGAGAEAVAFVDHGMVRYQASGGTATDRLSSFGVGVSGNIGGGFSLALYAAAPIGSYAPGIDDSGKAHLYLQYDFF